MFVLKDNNPAPNLTLMISVTISSYYKHTIKLCFFELFTFTFFFNYICVCVCVRLMTFHMNWNIYIAKKERSTTKPRQHTTLH